MGTRSAPLVFLLLAACMASDGTQTATRTGDAPPPAADTAGRVALPADLPAVPRMRPGKPGDTESTDTAQTKSGGASGSVRSAQAGAAGLAGSSGLPAAAEAGDNGATQANAGRVAGTQDAPGSAAATAGKIASADAPGAGSSSPSELPSDVSPVAATGPDAGRTEAALPSGTDASTVASGAPLGTDASDVASGPPSGSEPWPPAGSSGGSWTGADGDSGTALDTRVAVAPPLEDTGIDVESLFDGDVVRYCAAMWQMGEYIGAARRRGEPFKRAIGDAVRRIAAEEQLPLDNRLAFSGQVYGRLLYRLDEGHASLTLGTYVHFACLTVRGDKKIVPADPNAERLLNAGLAHCENVAFTRDKLNDCLFRELTPIVDRRNS
jgi:hypothetical protein